VKKADAIVDMFQQHIAAWKIRFFIEVVIRKNELKAFNEERNQLKKQMKTMHKKLVDSKEEAKVAEAKAASGHSASDVARISDLEAEIQALKIEKKDLQSRLDSSGDSPAGKKSRKPSSREESGGSAASETIIRNLREELDAVRTRMYESEIKKNALQAQVETLTIKVQAEEELKNESIKHSTATIAVLDEALKEHKARAAMFSEGTEGIAAERQAMKAGLEEAKAEAARLKSENEELSLRSEKGTAERRSLERLVTEITVNMHSREKRVAEFKAEAEAKAKAIEDLTFKLNNHKAEMDIITQRVLTSEQLQRKAETELAKANLDRERTGMRVNDLESSIQRVLKIASSAKQYSLMLEERMSIAKQQAETAEMQAQKKLAAAQKLAEDAEAAATSYLQQSSRPGGARRLVGLPEESVDGDLNDADYTVDELELAAAHRSRLEGDTYAGATSRSPFPSGRTYGLPNLTSPAAAASGRGAVDTAPVESRLVALVNVLENRIDKMDYMAAMIEEEKEEGPVDDVELSDSLEEMDTFEDPLVESKRAEFEKAEDERILKAEEKLAILKEHRLVLQNQESALLEKMVVAQREIDKKTTEVIEIKGDLTELQQKMANLEKSNIAMMTELQAWEDEIIATSGSVPTDEERMARASKLLEGDRQLHQSFEISQEVTKEIATVTNELGMLRDAANALHLQKAVLDTLLKDHQAIENAQANEIAQMKEGQARRRKAELDRIERMANRKKERDERIAIKERKRAIRAEKRAARLEKWNSIQRSSPVEGSAAALLASFSSTQSQSNGESPLSPADKGFPLRHTMPAGEPVGFHQPPRSIKSAVNAIPARFPSANVRSNHADTAANGSSSLVPFSSDGGNTEEPTLEITRVANNVHSVGDRISQLLASINNMSLEPRADNDGGVDNDEEDHLYFGHSNSMAASAAHHANDYSFLDGGGLISMPELSNNTGVAARAFMPLRPHELAYGRGQQYTRHSPPYAIDENPHDLADRMVSLHEELKGMAFQVGQCRLALNRVSFEVRPRRLEALQAWALAFEEQWGRPPGPADCRSATTWPLVEAYTRTQRKEYEMYLEIQSLCNEGRFQLKSLQTMITNYKIMLKSVSMNGAGLFGGNSDAFSAVYDESKLPVTADDLYQLHSAFAPLLPPVFDDPMKWLFSGNKGAPVNSFGADLSVSSNRHVANPHVPPSSSSATQSKYGGPAINYEMSSISLSSKPSFVAPPPNSSSYSSPARAIPLAVSNIARNGSFDNDDAQDGDLDDDSWTVSVASERPTEMSKQESKQAEFRLKKQQQAREQVLQATGPSKEEIALDQLSSDVERMQSELDEALILLQDSKDEYRAQLSRQEFAAREVQLWEESYCNKFTDKSPVNLTEIDKRAAGGWPLYETLKKQTEESKALKRKVEVLVDLAVEKQLRVDDKNEDLRVAQDKHTAWKKKRDRAVASRQRKEGSEGSTSPRRMSLQDMVVLDADAEGWNEAKVDVESEIKKLHSEISVVENFIGPCEESLEQFQERKKKLKKMAYAWIEQFKTDHKREPTDDEKRANIGDIFVERTDIQAREQLLTTQKNQAYEILDKLKKLLQQKEARLHLILTNLNPVKNI
jgi:hypothetical protein